ncbi:MAG TPA: cell envelope integrity protein CreD [Chitinophagaceae bacterium]|nr:cell envelope integrity protein CreD [Chitinophagaceae bacterium]
MASFISNFQPGDTARETTGLSNKILIKSVVIGALVLIMLIPSNLVQHLITERQDRQQQVVEEVSSKWAKPQTLSAPYLSIPYYLNGNPAQKKQLVLLADELKVKGEITEEDRKRSIFKVMLYRTSLVFSGSFRYPQNIDSSTLILKDARLCFGLSDFRGIEDKLEIKLGNTVYSLTNGLPNTIIDSTGLSCPVSITGTELANSIGFNTAINLRGSASLHFLPVASFSNYEIKSSWPNPSFDGNTLPLQRHISGQGFLANWKFNAANLPFSNIVTSSFANHSDIVFGVTLIQPVGQYVKSMRSAKYAILIIGLTFALFFTFELLQKRPVHPVQYALIGIALVIFYTLLVSISEMMLFEYAYLIAAAATTVLISLYAKTHFKTTRSAVIVCFLLIGLYSIIYILISLEDTALLTGSIALFIAVAVIMYVTRKINWYNAPERVLTDFQP